MTCFQKDEWSKARYFFTAKSEHNRLVSLRSIAKKIFQPETLESGTYAIPLEFCFGHSRTTAATTNAKKLLNMYEPTRVFYVLEYYPKTGAAFSQYLTGGTIIRKNIPKPIIEIKKTSPVFCWKNEII